MCCLVNFEDRCREWPFLGTSERECGDPGPVAPSATCRPRLAEDVAVGARWQPWEQATISHRVSSLLSILLHIERKNSGTHRHRNLNVGKKRDG